TTPSATPASTPPPGSTPPASSAPAGGAPAPSSTPASATPAPPPYPTTPRTEPTGWIGWVFFAGIMMIMVGAFQAIMGLVALFDDGYYLVTRTGLVVRAGYTQWGWTHIILGVVAVIAGFCVLLGQTWARVVGIILAIVSALVN